MAEIDTFVANSFEVSFSYASDDVSEAITCSFLEDSESTAGLDFWVYESDLLEPALELLGMLKRRVNDRYGRMVFETGLAPRALLRAAWYLIRLGCISSSGVVHGEAFRPAHELTNYLPEDLIAEDSEAMKIIAASPFARKARSINSELSDHVLAA